jgi:ABC-type lipoprotein export system ATPase subunit
MGSRLAALGGSHLLGGSHGHHGLRIVILVVIVVAVAVGVFLLVRRSRARPRSAPGAPPVDTGAVWATRSTGRDGPKPLDVTPVDPARAPNPSSAAGSANTIRATELTKRFGEKVAVDTLSFDVKPGQVTGFLGPNGAGRSTTMHMIMGLDHPDAGSVTVNGRPHRGLAWPLREVGALLEAKAIHPGRSAYAHLWMLAKTNHIPRRRVDEVLGLVCLSSVADQRVGQFSLGMGQRLGIAAALLRDPGVLMFDEPVNGPWDWPSSSATRQRPSARSSVCSSSSRSSPTCCRRSRTMSAGSCRPTSAPG